MLSWRALESSIALASNIARDYLKYRTSDTNEKKALEADIETNPQNYTDTVFAQEVTDSNDEFNNETFTNLENNIKENPQNFVNSDSEAISNEATDLLDNDKRNDEIAEDMYVKIRQEENRDWANNLIEKYNSQNQYEMPEDLFDDLTEEDVDFASEMLDELLFGNTNEADADFDIEQAQADDAYAMGKEENNYLPPEQFKQVGAFLGGIPSVAEDVEYSIRDEDPAEFIENKAVEGQADEQEEENEEEKARKTRRSNFLNKLKRSISANPANGSFTAEETDIENNNGGAIGKGIGSNIIGQSGGIGINASLGGNSDSKEQELEEYKEQRNIDSELHYDDVPVEQMSSINNPGANNGNTEEEKSSIKVPKANTSFSVKNTKLDGKTGHAYGPNNIELKDIANTADDITNDLEEVLKSLDDYSIFEPLVIENINDEILVDGNPLKMTSNETLKYIESKLGETE